MLILAAILLLMVSAMHSILGERYLITPLLRRSDLPIILSARRNTDRTIRLAWHTLTLTWIGIAAALIILHAAPDYAIHAIVGSMTAVFGISAAVGGVAMRGKHPSWPFFLGISLLLAWTLYMAH